MLKISSIKIYMCFFYSNTEFLLKNQIKHDRLTYSNVSAWMSDLPNFVNKILDILTWQERI